MGDSLLLWMTLALTLFWGVGVYNRLMRMRARGLDAFGSVESHLRQFADLVREQGPQVDTGRAHAATARHGEPTLVWKALEAALQALDHALKASRAMPLAEESLARVATAMVDLQDAWAVLRDAPADLAGPMLPDAMRKRWDAIAWSVETSRNGFNQIMRTYNQALTQFPARVIVGPMGFKPGGAL